MTGTGSSGSSLRPSRHGGQGPEVQVNAPARESGRRLRSECWTANQLESGREGSRAKNGLPRTRTDLLAPLPVLPLIKQDVNYFLYPDILNITRIRKKIAIFKIDGSAIAAPSS